jgi:hypothetical protein
MLILRPTLAPGQQAVKSAPRSVESSSSAGGQVPDPGVAIRNSQTVAISGIGANLGKHAGEKATVASGIFASHPIAALTVARRLE